MTAFATVITSGGTSLRWLDVGTSLGRYERVSGSIGGSVSVILDALEAAIPLEAPVVVVWDNSPEVDISSGDAVLANEEPMKILVAVRWRECRRMGTASISTDAWRFTGVLSIAFMAPVNRGDGAIYEAADYVADEFRALTDGEVEWRTPTVSNSEAPSGYFARTVEIPFDVDEDNDRLTHVAPVALPVAFEDAAMVVSDRFQTEVADPIGLETHFDNSPYDPPSNEAWCSLSIIQGGTRLSARGSTTRNYRTLGIAQASIFVPLNAGDADGLAIADDIFDAFHAVHDRGVTFKNPAIVESGRSGPYWRIVVRIPFEVEAIQ